VPARRSRSGRRRRRVGLGRRLASRDSRLRSRASRDSDGRRRREGGGEFGPRLRSGNPRIEPYISLVLWPTCQCGCCGFADTGIIFSYPCRIARWAQIFTRTRARGHILTPVSAPAGSGARGYADFMCPLPSVSKTPMETTQ
jgi:hypothetical protein